MSSIADHAFGERLCRLLNLDSERLTWLALNVDSDGAVTVVTEVELTSDERELLLKEMAVYDVLLLERTAGGTDDPTDN